VEADKKPKEKSKLSDNVLLLVLSVLGLIGLFSYLKLQDQVFPSAAINFALTKEQIMEEALMWKGKAKIPGNYPISSATFNLDNASKNFLDFKLGTKEANRVMSEEAPIFWWDIKYAEPKNDESVEIQLSPDGKLVALEYKLSKDRALPNISHDEAKARALEFIAGLTGLATDQFAIKQDTTTPLSNRIDHSFTLENKNYDWAGAKLRTNITYSGNLLTEYNAFVHKPEAWDRQYSKMRSANELLQRIATIFYVLLNPVALFLAISQWQRGNVRLKFALITALVFSLIGLIDNYNELPFSLANYTSEKSYPGFVALTLLSPLMTALMTFVGSTVLIMAGEFIYRKTFPDKLALEEMLSKNGLASKEVRMGLLIGIVWCAVSLGYQITYYYLGRKVGFWCPIQLDQYQVLGSYFPWFGAVGLGVSASGSEELLYRVLFLGLMQPLVKRFWLANLLQAAGWGFMHSSYEQQPCYARGLELTIEGMLDGWILRRFGLLPCLVSHYLFDAFCCVTPLFKAPLELKYTAIFPLIPVLVMLAYAYMLKGKRPAALLNGEIPIKAIVQEKTSKLDMTVEYEPIKKTWRWRLLALIVLIMGTVATLADDVKRVGDNVKPLKISRDMAIQKARSILAEKQIDLTGYRHYVTLTNSYGNHSEEFQYIFEKVGLKKTIEIADAIEHSVITSVQFVKAETPQYYGVTMAEDGKMLSLSVTLAEEDKAREITKEEAQSLVRAFIREYRPVYYPLDDDQYSAKRMPERIDHTVTFKIPTYTVAEAPLKVSMDVLGDRACNISHYWDTPESWNWKRRLKTRKDEILSFVNYAVYAVFIFIGIYTVVTVFRSHKVKWPLPLLVSLAWVLFGLLQNGNDLINLYANYDVNKPLQDFYLQEAINRANSIFLPPLGLIFALAIVFAALTSNIKQKLKTVYIMLFPAHLDEYSKLHRDYWLDALLLGGTAAAASFAIGLAFKYLDIQFSQDISVTSNIQPLISDINSFIPPLADVLGLVRPVFDEALKLGIMVTVALVLRLTTLKKLLPFVIAFLIFGASNQKHWPDFFITLASSITTFIFTWFVVTKAGGRNLLSLAIFCFYVNCLSRLQLLWEYSRDVCYRDIVTVIVMMCLPLLYLLYNQRIHKLSKKLKLRRNKSN